MIGHNTAPVIGRRPDHVTTPRRMGFTLVEMLLVLTLLASLLGATIGLMSIARTSNQQAKKELLSRQQIRRFADDVRRDVRSAQELEVVDGKLILSNEEPNRRTVYSVESGSTIRRHIEDSTAQVPLTDHYDIGDSMKIEIQTMDPIGAVQWTFTQSDRPSQPIQILASRGFAP